MAGTNPDPTDPCDWALLREVHAAIAKVCCGSDYAAESLILDFLHSRPEEPPRLTGFQSSLPNGRPVDLNPRLWGITDHKWHRSVMVDWPNSRVVCVQESIPALESTIRVVNKLLVPYGALPAGTYVNELVQLPRSVIPEILCFGRLPVPPELLGIERTRGRSGADQFPAPEVKGSQPSFSQAVEKSGKRRGAAQRKIFEAVKEIWPPDGTVPPDITSPAELRDAIEGLYKHKAKGARPLAPPSWPSCKRFLRGQRGT